jgi:hypothetical protein
MWVKWGKEKKKSWLSHLGETTEKMGTGKGRCMLYIP